MAKEKKKRRKSYVIKRGGEDIVMKACACCEISFEQESPNQAYCPSCRSEIYKSWVSGHKQKVIYKFVPTIRKFDEEVTYLGSTDNIASRMSDHFNRYSAVSKKIMDTQYESYDVYYAEVDGVNREELFAIEYYLMNSYKTTHGENPFGNSDDKYQFDKISTSRLNELYEIADGLEFSNKYDVLRHKIKEIEMKNLLKQES